jgi:hypothetical protein
MANRRQRRREKRQERKANQQMTVGGFTPQTSQVVSGTPYDSPTGAYQTYQTQLPGGQQAYSQNEIGPAGQQYLADYLAGNTTGSFAEWQAAGGYKGGGAADAAPAAAATTTGGGGKQQQKTQNPLRQALQGAGKSLSGKEAMQILRDTGVKQDRLLKTAQQMGLGLQGSLERRVQKGQLGTAQENLLGSIFDQGGIPSTLDPRSQIQKTLASGTVGLQPGQRLTGVTKTGQPILTTKDQLAAQRQPIAAAPDVGQPAATAPAETEAPSDMTAMDSLGAIDSYAPDPLVSLLDEMMAGFTDAMSGYQQNQADMYSSLLDSIAATGAPRLYGAGRNYNVDAIRAALASRRPRGRSSYLRGGTTGGSPMSIGAFAPAVAGLTGGGINI